MTEQEEITKLRAALEEITKYGGGAEETARKALEPKFEVVDGCIYKFWDDLTTVKPLYIAYEKGIEDSWDHCEQLTYEEAKNLLPYIFKDYVKKSDKPQLTITEDEVDYLKEWLYKSDRLAGYLRRIIQKLLDGATSEDHDSTVITIENVDSLSETHINSLKEIDKHFELAKEAMDACVSLYENEPIMHPADKKAFNLFNIGKRIKEAMESEE